LSNPSFAVVGAGPAGATAARLLASRGASVTLFEARRLPRHKLCGGGLTPKAQRLVPASVLETVEHRVHLVELRGGWLPPLVLDESAAEIAMVERSTFDLALTRAAADAGAQVCDDERVEAVAEDGDGITVTTGRGRLRVDAIVVADGDPSGIARLLGLGGPAARHSLALEVDLPIAPRLPPDTAVLSFDIPGGYSWYFPKGDHASVGAGTYRGTAHAGPAPERLERALTRFIRSVGLEVPDGKIAGHWIPQGLRQGKLASPRSVLVGDSAATVDPLFGEGIAYALTSGAVAAGVIEDWQAGRERDLLAYDAKLRALLGPAFGRLRFAALAAERSTTLAMGLMRLSPWARRMAVDAIAGRRPPFSVGEDWEVA
jgi:geranylgeranyl reductase family protein